MVRGSGDCRSSSELEKIKGECSDHNGMVDLPFSDQFWNINKRNENNLDVFGLIGCGSRNFLDILSQKSMAAIIEDCRVGIEDADLRPLFCLVARLLQ